jgi:ATP/maltotriose-dependent transcriptional regulator MalT
LGILLAAAWVGMLSPAEIAAEISGEISRSLDFLETDLRDVPARQRSMRAVFDHSWNLITARSRAVMQALSVFRGGFTREAAQHVTGGSLRELKMLADRSLLRRTATGRYEPYHELLRQYAQERLKASGRADRVRQRHSEYYLNVLHQRRADLLLRDYRPLTALPVASREQADVAASPTRTVSQSLIDPLTRRELEVLQLIAAGLSNQEIAEQLVVALSTVKKHINRIYSKLGVKRRTQAVVRARELNLL